MSPIAIEWVIERGDCVVRECDADLEDGGCLAELLLRRELPSGDVQHFEGFRFSERLVRVTLPSGYVQHFEGKRGAERLVRVDRADGLTVYCW